MAHGITAQNGPVEALPLRIRSAWIVYEGVGSQIGPVVPVVVGVLEGGVIVVGRVS